MSQILSDAALDQLFREARSFSYWLDKPVSDEQLEAIYELLKMGPTGSNQQPVRIVWCKSDAAKERLAAHASDGNKRKILTAPVCAIIAMDLEFHEELPWLFPHQDAKSWFDDPADRAESALKNSSLQGAYLMLAARALGLDCGPMGGFDNAAVDKEFFADQPSWRSNFICSIGYGDRSRLHERLPRPEFERFNRVI